MRIKIALFSILLFSLFLGTTLYSFAQTEEQGLDLTVSPPVFDLTAKPGEEVKERFRIRNNQTEDVELQITARRLISDPENGSPIPEDSAQGEELSWVSFDPSTFTAPAREWTDVNFTIDIPDDAAYGYYYVFRITPKENALQESTGAAVKGELLVVVLLNVKKEGAVSQAELQEFKTQQFINEYLPVEFNVTLRNKGNVHVKPRGNIFISRGGGDSIAVLEVNDTLGSILPEGIRTFNSSWLDGFLVREPVVKNGKTIVNEKGEIETKLTIHWNKLTELRIGPYTANLVMVYDDGNRDQVIEGTTTFWVIPYTFIGATLLVLVVLFFVIRFVLRWYIRREISKRKR